MLYLKIILIQIILLNRQHKLNQYQHNHKDQHQLNHKDQHQLNHKDQHQFYHKDQHQLNHKHHNQKEDIEINITKYIYFILIYI